MNSFFAYETILNANERGEVPFSPELSAERGLRVWIGRLERDADGARGCLRESIRATRAAFRREGDARDFLVHGWRSVAARSVRLQRAAQGGAREEADHSFRRSRVDSWVGEVHVARADVSFCPAWAVWHDYVGFAATTCDGR